MKTIIAATDFLPVSLNAVEYAANLALELKGKLLLINIVEIPLSITDVPITDFYYDEAMKESEEKLEDLRSRLLYYTANKIGITVKNAFGGVLAEIEEATHHKDVFAVVMGEDDNTFAEQLLSGSNTASAIKRFPVPVIVIPKNITFTPISSVLIAIDLDEEYSTESFEILRETVKSFGVKSEVVYVSNNNLSSQALSASMNLQNQLNGFDFELHNIESENILKGIEEFIVKQKPTLLILMARKYGLFKTLFHKSVTNQLTRHINIPILIIPA